MKIQEQRQSSESEIEVSVCICHLKLSSSGFYFLYFLSAGRTFPNLREMLAKKYTRVINMGCHSGNPPLRIPVVLFSQGLFLM